MRPTPRCVFFRSAESVRGECALCARRFQVRRARCKNRLIALLKRFAYQSLKLRACSRLRVLPIPRVNARKLCERVRESLGFMMRSIRSCCEHHPIRPRCCLCAANSRQRQNSVSPLSVRAKPLRMDAFKRGEWRQNLPRAESPSCQAALVGLTRKRTAVLSVLADEPSQCSQQEVRIPIRLSTHRSLMRSSRRVARSSPNSAHSSSLARKCSHGGIESLRRCRWSSSSLRQRSDQARS